MKKLLCRSLCLLFCCLLLLPLKAYASGSGNMDGGGTEMGQGTSTDYWTPGHDGVRVTVVEASSGNICSSSVDFSNKSFHKTIIHFAKKCKLSYLSGASLEPAGGIYTYQIPALAMPTIVTSGSRPASIAATKRYFCSEYAARMVADATGFSYEDLISGQYKLIIEPIAYFTFSGNFYAMTATEAALYNQSSGGSLSSKLPSIVQKNLPLAIFLEQSEFGIPAWGGSTTQRVSDAEILSTLGIGIVSYTEQPDIGLEAPDVTYRVDTDVITSITLTTGRDVNPDNPATVTFHINGQSYTVTNIVIPENSTQVVWAKWHTPASPTRLSITVDVSGASTAKTSFVAAIVDLNENIPPDPTATDTNPRFSVPSLPSNPQNTSASWSIWSAWWQADWQWVSDWDWESGSHSSSCADDCTSSHGHWVDNGEWVDFGEYIFESTAYSASLSGSAVVAPDDIVPTASGDSMKSGYGIKEDISARMRVNAPASHYAPAQTAVSYFPEFGYKTYWRLLTCNGGLNATFQFRPNEYSTYNRQVHFTPLWYPDHTSYTVYTHVIDAWTPAGMLSLNLNDSVQINGSLYDDWFSKRE